MTGSKRPLIVNLRLMAIDNCLSSSSAWYVEKAYRHVSKTYHTPLHVAKTLYSEEEAIKMMMEDEMADMPVEELSEIKTKILAPETPKAFLADASLLVSEEAEISDDDWVAMQDSLLKEQEKKAAEKKGATIEDAKKAIEKSTETLASSLNTLMKAIGKEEVPDPERPLTFPKE